MSDEQKPDEQADEQADQQADEQGEQHPTPDERLEDVGTNRGTYDLPEPGEGQRESGTAGLPDEDEVPDETIEEIDTERAERLDADNRPEGAEVDNTQRTFDAGAGMFTDTPDYDENDRPYAADEDDAGPPEDTSGETRGDRVEQQSEQDDGQDDQQDDQQEPVSAT